MDQKTAYEVLRGVQLPWGWHALKTLLLMACYFKALWSALLGRPPARRRLAVWTYGKLMQAALSSWARRRLGEHRARALWYSLSSDLAYELTCG